MKSSKNQEKASSNSATMTLSSPRHFPEFPSINITVRSNFHPHNTSQARLNFNTLSLGNWTATKSHQTLWLLQQRGTGRPEAQWSYSSSSCYKQRQALVKCLNSKKGLSSAGYVKSPLPSFLPPSLPSSLPLFLNSFPPFIPSSLLLSLS